MSLLPKLFAYQDPFSLVLGTKREEPKPVAVKEVRLNNWACATEKDCAPPPVKEAVKELTPVRKFCVGDLVRQKDPEDLRELGMPYSISLGSQERLIRRIQRSNGFICVSENGSRYMPARFVLVAPAPREPMAD